MGYTVKDVRAIIENLDDDTPLFGFILGPNDVEIYTTGEDVGKPEQKGYYNPSAEEWAKVVDKADSLAIRGSHSVWDLIWDIINDAKSELFPEEAE